MTGDVAKVCALAILWTEAATGERRWHMVEHAGRAFAIDLDACRLEVGPLTMAIVERDDDFHRFDVRQDIRFRMHRPSPAMFLGVTAP